MKLLFLHTVPKLVPNLTELGKSPQLVDNQTGKVYSRIVAQSTR